MILFRELQNVMKTFDIDSQGEGGVLFCNSTEKSREMNDPIDSVVHDNFLKAFEIQHIREQVRTCECGKRRSGLVVRLLRFNSSLLKCVVKNINFRLYYIHVGTIDLRLRRRLGYFRLY